MEELVQYSGGSSSHGSIQLSWEAVRFYLALCPGIQNTQWQHDMSSKTVGISSPTMYKLAIYAESISGKFHLVPKLSSSVMPECQKYQHPDDHFNLGFTYLVLCIACLGPHCGDYHKTPYCLNSFTFFVNLSPCPMTL